MLKAASVSRKHATITLKNGTAFIRYHAKPSPDLTVSVTETLPNALQ